jgi:hypothetical protein
MTKYEEYAIIDAQEKAFKAKKEELRAEIVQEIIEKGSDTVVTPVGKFTIAKLKKWNYTPEVARLKEELDARKAKEESEEIASYEESPSLRYSPIKL